MGGFIGLGLDRQIMYAVRHDRVLPNPRPPAWSDGFFYDNVLYSQVAKLVDAY